MYFLKERRSGHDAAPAAEAQDRSVEAAVPTRA
ncbi:hypothetical protein QFZ57_000709 [Arthrobacter sp. B1I2]|nr:hypothetical protein [Arthrobacter sp. B1I2]